MIGERAGEHLLPCLLLQDQIFLKLGGGRAGMFTWDNKLDYW